MEYNKTKSNLELQLKIKRLTMQKKVPQKERHLILEQFELSMS
jgi:hypothetical protein